jgi:sulfoxide reductase heme-binding subunit YedZ
MYRLVPLPTDSDPKPSLRGIIVSIFVVVALSLLGLLSLAVIGYYLPETSTKAYWFISRSSGIVAYVLITIGVLWGLVQSGALFRTRVPPVLALGLHSYLNWIGIGFAALHGIILIGDGYINIDLARVLMPFISTYRPIPVGLGIVGFYLMLLLSLSFYARPHLGQKNFRLLHYASFLVFALVTLHGVLAGTDSGPLWWLYATSLVAVVWLTVMRIVSTRRAKAQQAARPAPALRPAAVAQGAAQPAGIRRTSANPGRPVSPSQR